MGKIELLPPELISKIAAGEVIERPASVVKELLENAIDAGSDSVDIELEKAGKILVRVKDTGTGMEKDDLEKIFLRHSTSKIKTSEDLFNINSLGFRGEALYSVQAIADITIKTKTHQSDMGWQTHARGGSAPVVTPYTMNEGTSIEVRELFFNTPARRKFLKTDSTELNQILNVVIPYSILHENIKFSLSNNERIILDLSANNNKLSRMAEVLNINKDDLILSEALSEDNSISIELILGNINIQRVKRDMQFIFVNNRPVFNKAISFHINQIYKLIFPQNIHPCFACFVHLPNEDIDVNIHPTKREINLKDEKKFIPLLRRTCERALMEHGKAKAVTLCEKPEARGQKPENALQNSTEKKFGVDIPFNKSFKKLEEEFSKMSDTSLDSTEDKFTQDTRLKTQDSKQYVLFTGDNKPREALEKDLENYTQKTLANKLSIAAYIGKFINKYLLFESNETLLIVDQHAAQERITYESLLKQLLSKKIEVQRLLLPIMLDLSTQELVVWENIHNDIEKIGFDTTKMKGNSIAIHSHPALINKPDIAVMNILSTDDTRYQIRDTRYDPNDIARRACRKSVKAGDILKPEEADSLKEQLLNCDNSFTCPHGRPTVIEITDKFLERQFLRQL
ncbi:MAG: DNA mismatch repair endonuclease MutL [Candidatus Omnitrophica bacterium]|nr:DNA mismatch repair endonuclease MutL [Candidatus Omnitrophota bacterium]